MTCSPPVSRAATAIGRGLRAALRAKLDARVAGRDEELQVAVRAAGPSQ